MRQHRLALLVIILLIASLAFAAEPKVEKLGPFDGKAPDAVKAALEQDGYRVVAADGKALAEIWAPKAVAAKKANSGSLYPELTNGQFVGLMRVPVSSGDFRGQEIPAGVYTLRYQLLPGDGNHMGVAPNPDFFLLVPADLDPDPAKVIGYNDLVKLSAKAAGTQHPAAYNLAMPAAKPPAATASEEGYVIFTYRVKTTLGTEMTIGFIVKGRAEL